MPALQSLDLRGPIFPEAVNWTLLEPVYLQNLQNLIVCSTVSMIRFFLCNFNFPAVMHTIICCKYLDPDLQLATLSPMFVPLKWLLSERPHPLKLHYINVVHYDHSALQFKGLISPECPLSLRGHDLNFPAFYPDFAFHMR